MKVALVLAAGTASRFGGGQKVLARLGGMPLVRRVSEQALKSVADRVLVVVGREGDAARQALQGLPLTTVHNPLHTEGMSTSIRTGIAALPPEARAVLVLLGDQPGVGPDLMDAVLEADPEGEADVVVPVYREGPGNPVLFRAPVFPELLELEGDRGARAVVERAPGRVLEVTLDRTMPRDVDTPGDLRRLEEELGG